MTIVLIDYGEMDYIIIERKVGEERYKMNKKIVNDIFVMLYPLLLLLGAWRHWAIMEEVSQTYQIPFLSLAVIKVLFFLLLGLFSYYFLTCNSDCHIFVIIIGVVELLLLLFPMIYIGVNGNLYEILIGKELVFGTVLTLYLVLIVKRFPEKIKNT